MRPTIDAVDDYMRQPALICSQKIGAALLPVAIVALLMWKMALLNSHHNEQARL